VQERLSRRGEEVPHVCSPQSTCLLRERGPPREKKKREALLGVTEGRIATEATSTKKIFRGPGKFRTPFRATRAQNHRLAPKVGKLGDSKEALLSSVGWSGAMSSLTFFQV